MHGRPDSVEGSTGAYTGVDVVVGVVAAQGYVPVSFFVYLDVEGGVGDGLGAVYVVERGGVDLVGVGVVKATWVVVSGDFDDVGTGGDGVLRSGFPGGAETEGVGIDVHMILATTKGGRETARSVVVISLILGPKSDVGLLEMVACTEVVMTLASSNIF